jgi:hypothetical protein
VDSGIKKEVVNPVEKKVVSGNDEGSALIMAIALGANPCCLKLLSLVFDFRGFEFVVVKLRSLE